jgi:septal ring factor EnvC (AmiA/AmiB activator)
MKQLNASGGGDSAVVVTAVRAMANSVYGLLVTCEEKALPSVSSLREPVQLCAQHTTKILHIAFAASDESLDTHVKLALASAEKLHHHINLCIAVLQNAEVQAVLSTAATDIEKLVQKLADLAGKQPAHQTEDPAQETRMREIAKQLAAQFRVITTVRFSLFSFSIFF